VSALHTDALHGVAVDWVAVDWPLALQGPDSPNGNILGWLIVFFMIVWPIIRGAIEAANERRRKFVEQERRRGQMGGPTAGPAAPTGRPTLERDPFEALRRAMEQARGDQERQGDEPPVRRATPQVPTRPVEPKTQKSRVPRAHQAGPVQHERESRPIVRSYTFGRDPFDDRELERPLVKDPELARVPSEGGQATETPRRRPTPAPQPPIDAPSPVIEPLTAALSSRGRAVPVGNFALQRIAQRVPSPWARAVVYEELLGPPVGQREPRI
jgi:hypothetical protein